MTSTCPVPPPFDRPIRLGALVSGGGRTLLNLVRHITTGRLDAEVAVVLSSRVCLGVDRARESGLTCHIVDRSQYSTTTSFSRVVFDHLRQSDVDLVFLAGFLSLIEIPDDFQFRVLNVHPALIPAFCGHGCYGDRVHAAVLERGVKVSGCTVHFADQQYDHGPIVLQKSVPVLDNDTVESLGARVFEAECEVCPEAVRLYAAGRLEITGRRVHTLPPPQSPSN